MSSQAESWLRARAFGSSGGGILAIIRAEDGSDYLEIDGLRFSRWKQSHRRRRLRFDPNRLAWVSFFNFMALACLASYWKDVNGGHPGGVDFLLSFLTVSSSMVAVGLFFRTELGGIGRLARRAEEEPKPDIPAGIPESAWPCLAVVNTAFGAEPASPGWLWTEGGMLRYRDDLTEFSLKPDDVDSAFRLVFGSRARVKLPQGVPALYLRLHSAILLAA